MFEKHRIKICKFPRCKISPSVVVGPEQSQFVFKTEFKYVARVKMMTIGYVLKAYTGCP